MSLPPREQIGCDVCGLSPWLFLVFGASCFGLGGAMMFLLLYR